MEREKTIKFHTRLQRNRERERKRLKTKNKKHVENANQNTLCIPSCVSIYDFFFLSYWQLDLDVKLMYTIHKMRKK